MTSAERGIYNKYRVERTDGRSEHGEKHENCFHFVLDLTHDPHAVEALEAYADSCAATHPALAADCNALVEKYRAIHGGQG